MAIKKLLKDMANVRDEVAQGRVTWIPDQLVPVDPGPDDMPSRRTRPEPPPLENEYLAGYDLYHQIQDLVSNYDVENGGTVKANKLSHTLPVAVVVGDDAHYIRKAEVINGQLWLTTSPQPYMTLPEEV